MEKIITVFGSSGIQPSELHYKKAEEIGKLIAENKFTTCSGGYGGIMEAVSKGAKSMNGKTIGITLENSKRTPNEYLDENVIMPNWVERLMELIAIGDAYIIFKGGSGTLVELSSLIEMMNKKIMKEKTILFYTCFWKKAIDVIKNESLSLNKIIEKRVLFASKVQDISKLLRKI